MKRLVVPTLLSALLLVGACDEDTDESEPEVREFVDAGDHGFTCEATEEPFPGFDKTCAVAEDCTLLAHTTTCCGDVVLIGIGKNSLSLLKEFEQQCRDAYDLCGCQPGLDRTELGERRIDPADTFAAECVEGECVAELLPAAGGAGGGAGDAGGGEAGAEDP